MCGIPVGENYRGIPPGGIDDQYAFPKGTAECNRACCIIIRMYAGYRRAGRRPLRSADNRICLVKRSRNQFGDRGFATAGPTLWNSLPVSA